MKNIFLNIVFILLIFNGLFAQTSLNFTEVSLPSASATAVAKYGDIPVNLSNGKVDIQLPVYNLTDGSINVPITLRYDASGVRPNEHPSMVGSNFSLFCGGTITRLVKGRADENLDTVETQILPANNCNNPTAFCGRPFRRGYYTNKDFGLLNPSNWSTSAYMESAFDDNQNSCYGDPMNVLIDTEPDEFRFNFNGYAGRFYLQQNGTWTVVSDVGIKVEDLGIDQFDYSDVYQEVWCANGSFKRLKTTSKGTYFKGFKITTPDGYQYIFDKPEFSGNLLNPVIGGWRADTWHLRQITSPTNEVATFEYHSNLKQQTANFSLEYSIERATFNSFWASINTDNTQDYKNYRFFGRGTVSHYPKKITTPNYVLDFEISESNELDYPISTMLEIARLNHIRDNINSPDFIKATPASEYQEGDFTYPPIGQDGQGQIINTLIWYQLDKIKLKNKANNALIKEFEFKYTDNSGERLKLLEFGEIGLPSYSFEYNPTQLPSSYLSTHGYVDHWGYYNGKSHAQFLLDLKDGNEVATDYFSLRQPDESFMKAEILEKINYPSGGYSTFDYEPKYYSKIYQRAENGDFTLYAPDCDAILDDCNCNQPPQCRCNTNCSIYNQCVASRTQCYDDLENHVNLTETDYAGGLRIKTIQSFPVKGLPTAKTFEYSAGTLHNLPKYYWEDYANEEGGNFTSQKFFIQSVLPLYDAQGDNVTYSKVTEDSGNNGYTEYYFTDFTDYPDEKYIDRFGSTHPLNLQTPFQNKAHWRGQTKEIRHYKEDNTLVSKEVFHLAPKTITGQPTIRAINLLKERTILNANLTINRAYSYDILVQPLKLMQKEVIQYDTDGGTDSVLIITNNHYENTYGFLASSTIENSDDKAHKTTYKYAEEAGITCLTNKHIIGVPVERNRYVDDVFQGGQKTIFQSFPTNLCLPSQEIELLKPATNGGTPPEVIRTQILEYTPEGFPKEVKVMNFPSTIYDWTGNLLDSTTNGIFTKSYTYYSDTRLLETATDIDGQISHFSYDDNERLILATSRNNNIKVIRDYSKVYGLTQDSTAIGNQLKTIIEYSDAPNQTTIETFDGLGRPLNTMLNGVVKNEIIYDNLGRVYQQTYLPSNFTTFLYDNSPLNRVVRETYPDGTFSTMAYGSQDNYYKVTQKDENTNPTTTLTDILGRPHQIINALEDATIYEYEDDRTNQPTKIIPPMGDDAKFTYHYTFDERVRLKTKTFPYKAQGITTTYTYTDSTDLMSTSTDAKGNVLTYHHDIYGRDSIRLLGNQIISAVKYDEGGGINIGKMTQSKVWQLGTDTAFTTDYEFDAFGRMEKSTAQNHVGGTDIIDYTYNQADWQLTALRQHTGHETLSIGMGYEYDGFGRVTKTIQSLSGQAQLLSQNAWNNRDQLVRKILGNGLQKIDYEYNNRGWLTQINRPFEYDGVIPDCSGGSSNSLTQPELLALLDADIHCGQTEESIDYVIANRFDSLSNFNVNCYNPCENTGGIHTEPNCTPTETSQQLSSLVVTRNNMKTAYTNSGFRQCANGSQEPFNQPDASKLTLPSKLYRIRLCNGSQAYVFENELAFITGDYHIIQEQAIDYATQLFSIKDGQGISSQVALEELIHLVVEGENIYINNFQPNQNPCSPQDFDCSTVEQTQNASILATIEAGNNNLNATDLNYPTNLYRVKLCGIGEVYLFPNELDQFPDNYSVLQTIPLANAGQKLVVGNTFNYSDGNDLFFLELHYNEEESKINANIQKNGNISFMDWQVKNSVRQSYGFQYDSLNRFKGATYSITQNYLPHNGYNVSGINYDANGNIESIIRNSTAPASQGCAKVIDNLTYNYIGNQLTSVTDNAPIANRTMGFNPHGRTGTYLYDANGNLSDDPYRNATFKYNHLNLPIEYENDQGCIRWDYDANGIKLRKRPCGIESVTRPNTTANQRSGAINETREYVGGIEYVNNQLEAIYHEEGRIVKKNGNFEWQWHFKDHLGNTRLLFSDINDDGSIDASSELLSIKNYYPFGMEWSGNTNDSPKNSYGYNGKELETDFDFNLLFYGARLHDPALGRFTGVDPISDKFPHLSTFNYASNDPISNIDLHGLQGTRFDVTFEHRAKKVLSGEMSKEEFLEAAKYEGIGAAAGAGVVFAGAYPAATLALAKDEALSYFTNGISDVVSLSKLAKNSFKKILSNLFSRSQRGIDNLEGINRLSKDEMAGIFGRGPKSDIIELDYGLASLDGDGFLDLVFDVPSGMKGQGVGANMFQDALDGFGSKVKGINGTWLGSGNLKDNYNSFVKHYENLGSEAVWKTFTGKQALKHGFTNAEVLFDPVRKRVDAKFTK